MESLRHPIRLVPSLFLLAIAIGTAALSLPIATADGIRAPFLIQEYAADLTKVIEADCTDADVLRLLGVKDFEAAVVAIGTDIEASVGVKRKGEAFIRAVPDTLIFPEDELVVSGRIKDIERFAAI